MTTYYRALDMFFQKRPTLPKKSRAIRGGIGGKRVIPTPDEAGDRLRRKTDLGSRYIGSCAS
ncbi:MAG TPA: hypothetical protein P5244_04300 [Syntrophales bacterium]|nr:hypothetical protein [Syntrophales bacterium]